MDVGLTAERVFAGVAIERGQAEQLVRDDTDPFDLMHSANRIRRHFKGNRVEFCSVINSKSGRCPNDCKFCAQSSRWNTGIRIHPLLTCGELVERSENIDSSAVGHVGIVTSGISISKSEELDSICRAIDEIQRLQPFRVCASLGELTPEKALKLKQAGLRRYHHNLEASPKFYPRLCSTYDYEKKLETVRTARDAGLEVCCGGIFGVGEDWEDRLDLAFTLRELDPESVPINFLRPIAGTPLENSAPLSPTEALKIIALYRFVLPNKTIKVCGGREYILRDMQSWMFYAGADGTMLGNYLTTDGRRPKEDLAMVRNLGLEYMTAAERIEKQVPHG